MIIDVSTYQGKIDWKKVAPNVDFVIIRASIGTKHDDRYVENAAGCKAYGVPYHAYHFLRATTEAEARNEAKAFADATEGTNPLFYVIDAESATVKSDIARKMCETFEEALRHYVSQDVRVAVYIGHHLYKSWNLDYDRYAYVWIPRYGSNDGKQHENPAYPCDIWQYTSVGKVAGITGNVDLDVLTSSKPLEYFTQGINNQNETAEIKETTGGATTMFTGQQLADYCKKVYEAGWVYWYGTYGKKCSKSLYTSKKKQYPDHYGSSRTSGYEKDIAAGKRCADCVGMIKSFFWTGNNFDTDPKYATNNCPDKSADGMFSLCKESGAIKTIPDIPGLVVHKKGHIGVYIGGGYTIEMKGFAYDCKKVKVTSGPWTEWGKLPASMISYDETPVAETPAVDDEPKPIQNGSKGTAVKQLQTYLIELGYSCGPDGADGDFGKNTLAALKKFQKDHGVAQTGVYDVDTIVAMGAALAARDKLPKNDAVVRIVNGNAHVRLKSNVLGKSIGIVHKGEVYKYLGQTASNGWNLIDFNGKEGWVSGKYSTVVD